MIQKGCLGTCWYGKYHYLEPWVGCENNCYYCYGRFRSIVKDTLGKFGASFEIPVPLGEPERMLGEIREGLKRDAVRIVKLSRYTDIFTPVFVNNGLAHDILKILCESDVERVIITSKSIPDKKIMSLMEKYRGKFSYNAALRPANKIEVEPGTEDVRDRIEAASAVNEMGIMTTVHLDPLIAGLDDVSRIESLLQDLQRHKLRRVMFSFLLLTADMIALFQSKIGGEVLSRVLGNYELEEKKQYLPRQEETVYFSLKPEVLESLVSAIGGRLAGMGFDFVLCSLKNKGTSQSVRSAHCPMCNGTFYA